MQALSSGVGRIHEREVGDDGPEADTHDHAYRKTHDKLDSLMGTGFGASKYHHIICNCAGKRSMALGTPVRKIG